MDDGLIQIFQLIAFCAAIFFLVQIIKMVGGGNGIIKKKTDCPPHVWDYDADGKMFCKNCPHKPGQRTGRDDSPY